MTDNNEVKMITSDHVRRDLQDLKGNVTLSFTLSMKGGARSAATIGAVREVMASFGKEEPRPNILIFVIDGDEEKPDSVAGVLSDLGKEPEVWRVPASADHKDSLRAFMKNRMRFGIYPHEAEGELVYDTQLVLLDQHLQIRGPVGVPIDWDFAKVASWEAEYEKALKEHPDKELIPPNLSLIHISEPTRPY